MICLTVYLVVAKYLQMTQNYMTLHLTVPRSKKTLTLYKSGQISGVSILMQINAKLCTLDYITKGLNIQ